MRHTRKRNNFGGISTVIVMALVIAVSIAIAVYFISYFLGLSSSVVGTAQAMVMVETFSTSATQITIKNTGSVPIKAILIVFKSLVGYTSSSSSSVYYLYLADLKSLPAGASMSIICSYVGETSKCTTTPNDYLDIEQSCPSSGPLQPYCSTSYSNLESTPISPGSYKVLVYILYSNGKVQVKDLGTFSTS